MFLTRNLLIDLSYIVSNKEQSNEKKEKNKTKTTKDPRTQMRETDVQYLRAAFAAVRASDKLDVATAVLVAASIPTLESLQNNRDRTRVSNFAKRIKF